MPSDRVDVAIVGAGFAGLTAARALVAAGRDVVVLEARDRVGGRVLDQVLDDGTVLELGGHWIGPTQARVHALLDELGIGTTPTYVAGDTVTIHAGRTHRHAGTLPTDLDPEVANAIHEFLARLDALAATVPIDRPWETPDAERLDGLTMAAWLDREVAEPAARAWLTAMVESLAIRTAGEVSVLDALFHAATAGSLDSAQAIEGGAQQDRIAGGPQSVAERLAKDLGQRVVLDAAVRDIVETADGLTLRTETGTYRARAAIVAVSPMLAGRIAFDPPLPAMRDGLAQRMPHGSVIKLQLVYPTPFWRADGLSGVSVSTDGAVAFTTDNSPADARCGVLVAFIEGREARRLGAASPDDRRAEALTALVRVFGPRAAEPELVVELDWSAEPWTRGCYSGHLTPGAWTTFGPSLREPCGRIHWAGTETAAWMCGYMDGAISSGERAATEILERYPVGPAQFAGSSPTSST